MKEWECWEKLLQSSSSSPTPSLSLPDCISELCRPGICLQDQGCKEDPFLVVNIPFCVSLTVTFREKESSGGLGLMLLASLVFRAFTSGPCSSCASLPFKGHLGSVPSGWSTVKKSFSSFVDCIVFVFRFIDIMLNH